MRLDKFYIALHRGPKIVNGFTTFYEGLFLTAVSDRVSDITTIFATEIIEENIRSMHYVIELLDENFNRIALSKPKVAKLELDFCVEEERKKFGDSIFEFLSDYLDENIMKRCLFEQELSKFEFLTDNHLYRFYNDDWGNLLGVITFPEGDYARSRYRVVADHCHELLHRENENYEISV